MSGHFHSESSFGKSDNSARASGRKRVFAKSLCSSFSFIHGCQSELNQLGSGVGKLILGRCASRGGMSPDATDRKMRLERRLPRSDKASELSHGEASSGARSIL